jgi:pilus assembly protein CpaF
MKNLSTKANSLDTNTEPLPEDSGIFNPDTFGTGLLDAEEQKHVEKWFYDIYDQLMKSIDLTMLTSIDEEQARLRVREAAQDFMQINSVPLSLDSRNRIIKKIEDEVIGLGPLEDLMRDATISDILVNRFDSVYVERKGKLTLSDIKFRNDGHLRNIIDRIVSNVGRRIDESSPMVDARLKDGSRVNAIIPPLAIDGPSVSIRRFAVDVLTVEKLIEYGSMTQNIAALLESVVKGGLNVLISGGTGTGKTTLLNVVSGYIPEDERIVTIEDSAELQLQQPHVLRLETRPANIEGKGEITQRDLVKNSLRMRPDRIVVGEVRGEEAFDMLQAMNTGHDGSLTTVHANSPRDALSRIENMVTMSGANLPLSAIRTQIASALHFVIQLERQEDGKRRIISIQEIQGMEGDVIIMSEIFRFERMGLDQEGNVLGDLVATGMVPNCQDMLKKKGMPLDMDLFEPSTFNNY